MKKVWQILSYILVAALAALVTLYFFGASPEDGKASKLDTLSGLIEERFIGEADRTAYEDAAAAAMVAALGDEWSYYIPASQYQAHVESVSNAYVGIGITITVSEDGTGFLITKVNPGGPADEAGMEPGDVIIGIEGQSASGMDAAQARDLVRGEVNTQVRLTVRRENRELEMDVTRMEVLSPVALGQMLPDKIGLITIVNFDDRCYDETKAAIDSLLDQGATALIFDVRNNPGGYKHELVNVLDYLLPAGPLFRSEFYTGEVTVDKSDASCLDIPMAVLVNESSFSAAEFFAAALSEYDAAIVVGQQTYGKGYFQTTIQLGDGSAVGLSVGRYTTPNGVSLAGVGITPDVVVEVDEETDFAIYAGTLEPRDDPQIQAAVDALKAN
ncbi:MAG: PDZ domain-containing protein [Ruminococcaceae bacterium]|nr:PDZ domain-containing protein [Oscillospiraceae bacterium]